MFSAPLFALPGRETFLGDSALLTGGRRNQDGEGEKRRRQEEIKMEKREKQEGEERKIRKKGKKGGMALPCSQIHYCIFCNGSTLLYVLPVICRGLISVLQSCHKALHYCTLPQGA